MNKNTDDIAQSFQKKLLSVLASQDPSLGIKFEGVDADCFDEQNLVATFQATANKVMSGQAVFYLEVFGTYQRAVHKVTKVTAKLSSDDPNEHRQNIYEGPISGVTAAIQRHLNRRSHDPEYEIDEAKIKKIVKEEVTRVLRRKRR